MAKYFTKRKSSSIPFEEIERAIELILNEKIINYKYDREIEKIILT
jgi:hypothetical protein